MALKIYQKFDIKDNNLKQRFIEIVESEKWKYRKKIKFPLRNDIEKYLYYVEVWAETEKNSIKLENNHLRGKEFCLDHIISIEYGYNHEINPLLIGSLNNIRIIKHKENLTKGKQLTEEAKFLLDKFNCNNLKINKEKIKIEIEPKDNITKNLNETWRLSNYPKGNRN